MTISSETRKAGPYTGNGLTTSFTFAFKVFTAADVLVVRTDLNALETVLTLSTDYTVTLNSNQDSNPGGTVVLPAALTSGYLLTLSSQVGALQATDLTNQGGFYPSVLNTALDKLTILVQQLKEQVSRSVKVDISSSITPATLTTYIVALYNNLANIITVAGNTSNINTVAGNTTNINTVATNNANVTVVGSNISNVNSVAGNSTNINAVNANSTNINAVNANSSNINTVASNSSNIATVVANIASIITNALNITSIQNASANATAAANSASSASTSATNAGNSASAAAASAASVNAAYLVNKDSSTGAAAIPTGTTAQRSVAGLVAGWFRFNTTLGKFEGYNGSVWGSVGGGATGGGSDSVFQENSTTVTTNYTLSTGKNAVVVGPLVVNTGVAVTVPSGQRLVVL